MVSGVSKSVKAAAVLTFEMSESFGMVKCRNKKDLYYKPTRFALYIRSQSLSAVSESRVLLDGFVIFHGRCM